MNFNETIVQLLEYPMLHARFVNTLSMLEYIGARKILKSQNAEDISMQILGHAAEEIRHSQILKGLALQLSNGSLATYSEQHLLCGTEAKAYFQSLDQTCAKALAEKDAKKNYILTTVFIEERAMRIYPEYEAILKERNIPNALRSIIRDEDKHLSDMQDKLAHGIGLSNKDFCDLRLLEETLFSAFTASVFKAIRSRPAYQNDSTQKNP